MPKIEDGNSDCQVQADSRYKPAVFGERRSTTPANDPCPDSMPFFTEPGEISHRRQKDASKAACRTSRRLRFLPFTQPPGAYSVSGRSSMDAAHDLDKMEALKRRISQLERSEKSAKRKLLQLREELKDVKSELGGAREETLDLQEKLDKAEQELGVTSGSLQRYRGWWLNEYHFVKVLLTMVPAQAIGDVQAIAASSHARFADWSAMHQR